MWFEKSSTSGRKSVCFHWERCTLMWYTDFLKKNLLCCTYKKKSVILFLFALLILHTVLSLSKSPFRGISVTSETWHMNHENQTCVYRVILWYSWFFCKCSWYSFTGQLWVIIELDHVLVAWKQQIIQWNVNSYNTCNALKPVMSNRSFHYFE